MSIVGYARVSSIGQSLDVQVDKLQQHGCTKIFKEKISGVTAQRPKLKECLSYLREGDVLVITKLDRLARSTLDLHRILDGLKRKNVDFKVIDQALDTSTTEGKLMFGILATVAEFETELRKERQIDGINKAKSNGVKFGRKNKLTAEQIAEMRTKRESGSKIVDLMDYYGISKATVYRLLG